MALLASTFNQFFIFNSLLADYKFEYIAGDAEYFNEIEQQLRDSQFNLYFKAK